MTYSTVIAVVWKTKGYVVKLEIQIKKRSHVPLKLCNQGAIYRIGLPLWTCEQESSEFWFSSASEIFSRPLSWRFPEPIIENQVQHREQAAESPAELVIDWSGMGVKQMQ